MQFKDRTQAGQLLAKKLSRLIDKKVIVYALPRGGVITAVEIAKFLHSPLDLIITRKIAHPNNPEYAIGAVAEDGHIVMGDKELVTKNSWLENEIQLQRQEAARRRKIYLFGRKPAPSKGSIAILVDDGVATGLTLQAGIIELKHLNPKQIIIAVPVIPESTAKSFSKEINELVALQIPADDEFLGGVGNYYQKFPQIEDRDIVDILSRHNTNYKKLQRG